MSSPYQLSLDKYNKVSNTLELKNLPNLGLECIKTARNISSSASGCSFSIANFDDIGMFIKFFPVLSNYVYKPHKKAFVEQPQFDPNMLEIGITEFMNSLLLRKLTQNLVFVYKTQTCMYAYETNVSKSDGKNIEAQDGYLVPGGYSQDKFLSRYNNGELADQINFMVVEKCDGDLETLFNTLCDQFNRGMISEANLNKVWDSIFLQIVLTLFILNDIFHGFYHNDLGPRNILYSYDLHETGSTFEYNILGKTYYVENEGYIPKLWDFSYVYIHEGNKELLQNSKKISYIRETDEFISHINEPIPNLPQLCASLMKLPGYNYIQYTNTGRKLHKIAQYKTEEWEEYFSMFYCCENSGSILEPRFVYDGY